MYRFRFPKPVTAIPLSVLALLAIAQSSVVASPFGQGVFGANVPFGSGTSLSIALGGNVSLALLPNGNNFSGTSSHIVTVTSTDTVGYLLYAHTTGSSNLTNGSDTIPASGNVSAAALSVGTWGYNTTGSTTNFLGLKTTNSTLKDATGPYKNGDATTVTYGALTSATQAAGTYATAVTYTAVAKNP
jgi:hypothetical protein